MTWKNERDLLIAQTMAFVQSVTGKTAYPERPLETPRPSEPANHPAIVEQRPVDVLPARLTPVSHGDLRDEIRRRVDAFRARQQAFDRERHEYCNAMMAKVRAAREVAAKTGDNPTPER
ncbi:hypothetical protein [Bradyrhizobium sp.]|uniref:hypothetical protein n=1 Tax=Bradyrhizobium sp. TaxID=376 RepID=UPI0026249600|nr:hypothetical protein [Bradyrhizobium sp.]